MASNSSGWTIDTLKVYIDTLIESQQTASDKAETALGKKFESVNEFRSALSDQQRTFIPRQEVDVLLKGINDRIDKNTSELLTLRDSIVSILSRKNTISEYIAYFIALLAIVASVILYISK